MNTVQASTLRKAAVWLATLLVFLQCGWLIVGCVLGLASIKSPVFSFGLALESQMFVLSISVAVVYCQFVAMREEKRAAQLIVGLVFFVPGFLGTVAFLVWLLDALLPGESRANQWSWALALALIILISLLGMWLFIGVVMIQHAFRVEPPLDQNDGSIENTIPS